MPVLESAMFRKMEEKKMPRKTDISQLKKIDLADATMKYLKDLNLHRGVNLRKSDFERRLKMAKEKHTEEYENFKKSLMSLYAEPK